MLRTATALALASLLTFSTNPASAQATAPSKPSSTAASKPKLSVFRGTYFEVKYPAEFRATPLEAKVAAESSAATFKSPDGAMEFYVFSPQWGGDAPGIALNPKTETETARRAEVGKSSGVAGTYSWYTITAKDKSYTRVYQSFTGKDEPIHWVIGMRYTSLEALARFKDDYARFKASLQQFAG